MQCIDFIPLLFQADLQWDYLEQPNEAAIFGNIAMIYCRHTYAVLLVQGGCTLGAKRLHFSGTVIILPIPVQNPRLLAFPSEV